jgi:hypothetical protein
VRIFVSSTFVDLREERNAAAEALRRSQLVPWGMELFVSEPSSPLDVCLRELRLSDAVVLIIGFYAGSLIPVAHGLTYTGAEFQLAQQLGKPVFAFFKTEGGKPLNKETDAAKKKALDDFRSALQVELLLAVEKWNAEGRPGSRFVFTTPKEADVARSRRTDRSPERISCGSDIRGRRLRRQRWDRKIKAATQLDADRERVHGALRQGECRMASRAAKEIPAGDVLIVVDDAHRFEFLDRLLVLARSLRQRPEG